VRWWKILALLVGALWSVFVFVASNDPDEVTSRIKGWFAVQWLQSGLLHLSNFAASTPVLAITFFSLGVFCATKLKRHKTNGWGPVPSFWAYDLGETMIDLRDRIENLLWENNVSDLVAAINVMAIDARSKGLVFPDANRCNNDLKLLIPYLTNVGAHLKANQIEQAKRFADKFASPEAAQP
jgi:hypothetical protein